MFSLIGKISTKVSWTADQTKPIATFILSVKVFLTEGFWMGFKKSL